MPSDPVYTCQQHLQTLCRFSLALVEAIKQSNLKPEHLQQAVPALLSGECVQCHIRVNGEELLALSNPTAPDEADSRVGRLRQGYCARKGCNSYYYRLTFASHPDIDWANLLSQTESVNEGQSSRDAAASTGAAGAKRAARLGLVRRALIGMAVAVILLVIRQWYLGGRIPFIREPENFEVDHIPGARPEAR